MTMSLPAPASQMPDDFAGSAAARADEFLALCREELGWGAAEFAARRAAVREEWAARGTWTPMFAELEHGARVAWRNNARCIGRLFWESLEVRDRREVVAPDAVYAELREHLRRAMNGGRIRAVATVFAPAGPDGRARVRIWNHQLLGYAGYEREDGTTLGDPRNRAITRAAMRLGWTGRGTAFDLLPILIEDAAGRVRRFPPPEEDAVEVAIRHPERAEFARLGARWYAVPVLADLAFRAGGLTFPAAPFNGWYMGTEIGARNLADVDRYDLLPRVADVLGLDRTRDRTLWKDRALVELNRAVLWSFEEAGVRMVDHHQAAVEFLEFARREERAGREVSAEWSWIVPPMSGAATPVFHRLWTVRAGAGPEFGPWRPGDAVTERRCPFSGEA